LVFPAQKNLPLFLSALFIVKYKKRRCLIKTKALSKRLTLNKETVSNLGDDQMKALHGGI